MVLSNDTGLGQRINMAFAGTTITKGKGVGIVVAVLSQNQSVMGKIFKLLEKSSETKGKTPLQKMLKKLAKYLTISAILISISITLLAFLINKM